MSDILHRWLAFMLGGYNRKTVVLSVLSFFMIMVALMAVFVEETTILPFYLLLCWAALNDGLKIIGKEDRNITLSDMKVYCALMVFYLISLFYTPF